MHPEERISRVGGYINKLDRGMSLLLSAAGHIVLFYFLFGGYVYPRPELEWAVFGLTAIVLSRGGFDEW